MKISDLFPKLFAAKQSAIGGAIVMTPGQAIWSERDFKQFADEAYRKNVIAYQAINKIADAAASIRWLVFRGETELTDHPLLQLINNPNPMQSGDVYMRQKVSYLMIAGNAYEERVKIGGQPREIYQLRPDRMKIIPGSTGNPQAYVYSVNNQKITFPVDPGTLDSDVRHLKLFNPTHDWYGLSPVEAASYAIDQHNEAMAWMQALLQNSARPSGALTTKDGQELSAEAFHRLKAQVEEQYSGARNAGRPMLLEGGLAWQQMGLSPADMGVIEAKLSAARDIALAFGVPPMLLGIPGDNTYSNYHEARLAFWEDTVQPLVDMIAGDWNAWLAEPFGVELRPDMDQVPAIVEKRNTLWQMADASQDLTINERRAMKGYEPIAGGDVLLVPSSQISLGMATEPLEADLKALAYGMELSGAKKAT